MSSDTTLSEAAIEACYPSYTGGLCANLACGLLRVQCRCAWTEICPTHWATSPRWRYCDCRVNNFGCNPPEKSDAVPQAVEEPAVEPVKAEAEPRASSSVPRHPYKPDYRKDYKLLMRERMLENKRRQENPEYDALCKFYEERQIRLSDGEVVHHDEVRINFNDKLRELRRMGNVQYLEKLRNGKQKLLSLFNKTCELVHAATARGYDLGLAPEVAKQQVLEVRSVISEKRAIALLYPGLPGKPPEVEALDLDRPQSPKRWVTEKFREDHHEMLKQRAERAGHTLRYEIEFMCCWFLQTAEPPKPREVKKVKKQKPLPPAPPPIPHFMRQTHQARRRKTAADSGEPSAS